MRKIKTNRKLLVQFHFWVDPDILEQLKGLAKSEGRTVTELLRESVAMLLRQRKTKNK